MPGKRRVQRGRKAASGFCRCPGPLYVYISLRFLCMVNKATAATRFRLFQGLVRTAGR